MPFDYYHTGFESDCSRRLLQSTQSGTFLVWENQNRLSEYGFNKTQEYQTLMKFLLHSLHESSWQKVLLKSSHLFTIPVEVAEALSWGIHLNYTGNKIHTKWAQETTLRTKIETYEGSQVKIETARTDTLCDLYQTRPAWQVIPLDSLSSKRTGGRLIEVNPHLYGLLLVTSLK